MGVDQGEADGDDAVELAPDCAQKKAKSNWDDCMCGQVCEMIKAYNDSPHKKEKLPQSPSEPGSPLKPAYDQSITSFEKDFAKAVEGAKGNLDDPAIKKMFYSPPPPAPPDCQHEKWKKAGGNAAPTRSGAGAVNPDHMHPASLSGPLTSANLKWADSRVNFTVGGSMKKLDSAPKKMKAHPSCNCT